MMGKMTDSPPAAVGKQLAIDELGEPALLVPVLLARALDANDRAKYLLALLQAARVEPTSRQGRGRPCERSALPRASPTPSSTRSWRGRSESSRACTSFPARPRFTRS